jgi:sugar phosphate isomerase/epimerase
LTPWLEYIFRVCESYRQLLPWAEDYNVIINVEPHGPYTTNGDFMERLLKHFDSEQIRFNFDTGNTYIFGLEPLDYFKCFRKYLTNSHIKDVSPELAAAARGEDTGIACSEMAIGEGVNAENIKKCIASQRERNWSGVICVECSGTDEDPQEHRIPARFAKVGWDAPKAPAARQEWSEGAADNRE